MVDSLVVWHLTMHVAISNVPYRYFCLKGPEDKGYRTDCRFESCHRSCATLTACPQTVCAAPGRTNVPVG